MSKTLSVRLKDKYYKVLQKLVNEHIAYNITHAIEIVINNYDKEKRNEDNTNSNNASTD